MSCGPHLIEPECFGSPGVRVCFTTRRGGCSAPPFAELNLAAHVGDDPGSVARNRAMLIERLGLPSPPCWLDQSHGNRILCIDRDPPATSADASIARTPGRVCAVMVADCVPLLMCNRRGTEVAAVHAGWRGLEHRIIASAVAAFTSKPSDLVAWLGPSISADAYQVGAELQQRFAAADPAYRSAFSRRQTSWHMDLAYLARAQLERVGVKSIHVDGRCVHRHADLFYSYRRDGLTGRMAALIWIDGG